jgi:hypothetical protein
VVELAIGAVGAEDEVGEVDAAAAADMHWMPELAFVALAVAWADHNVERVDSVGVVDFEGMRRVPFPIASWSKPEESDLLGALLAS